MTTGYLVALSLCSGKCFLDVKSGRRAETLKEAILPWYIQLGSHIVSDGRTAYVGIEEVKRGIYFHDNVIYQQQFADNVVQAQSRDLYH